MRDAVGVVPGDPLRDLPRARPPRPGGPPPHRQHPEKVWDMQIRRIYRNIIHTYQDWGAGAGAGCFWLLRAGAAKKALIHTYT